MNWKRFWGIEPKKPKVQRRYAHILKDQIINSSTEGVRLGDIIEHLESGETFLICDSGDLCGGKWVIFEYYSIKPITFSLREKFQIIGYVTTGPVEKQPEKFNVKYY